MQILIYRLLLTPTAKYQMKENHYNDKIHFSKHGGEYISKILSEINF